MLPGLVKLWEESKHTTLSFGSHEIKERFEQARDIETGRPEVKMIPMMYPARDSVAAAIKEKNKHAFA